MCCRAERGKMLDSPEDVLMASGMEMPSVAAFLHENYPNFVQEESVDDVATISDYLSQAGRHESPLSTSSSN